MRVAGEREQTELGDEHTSAGGRGGSRAPLRVLVWPVVPERGACREAEI